MLGAVACCSGCFAAYRRDGDRCRCWTKWEHQRFLGAECTYGDDRALTNMICATGGRPLRPPRGGVDGRARPLRQVLPPAAALEEVVGPRGADAARAPVAHPAAGACRRSPSRRSSGCSARIVLVLQRGGRRSPSRCIPAFYFLGLYLMAMGYALTHRALRSDGMWRYAIVGTFFYVMFSPQLLVGDRADPRRQLGHAGAATPGGRRTGRAGFAVARGRRARSGRARRVRRAPSRGGRPPGRIRRVTRPGVPLPVSLLRGPQPAPSYSREPAPRGGAPGRPPPAPGLPRHRRRGPGADVPRGRRRGGPRAVSPRCSATHMAMLRPPGSTPSGCASSWRTCEPAPRLPPRPAPDHVRRRPAHHWTTANPILEANGFTRGRRSSSPARSAATARCLHGRRRGARPPRLRALGRGRPHFLGHGDVAVDDRGGTGPFLTNRAWLPDAGRLETRDEFAGRVAATWTAGPRRSRRSAPGAPGLRISVRGRRRARQRPRARRDPAPHGQRPLPRLVRGRRRRPRRRAAAGRGCASCRASR